MTHDPLQDDEPEEPVFHDLDERTKARLRDAGRVGIANAYAALDAAKDRAATRSYPEYQRKEPRR